MLDTLIRNVTILDGTGAPGQAGDVGIAGDRIACVGGAAGGARLEVDGTGLTAAPGFIDIHTHSDFSLLIDGRGASALHQGVTTQVNGNCAANAGLTGRTFAEIGRVRGRPPFEAICDILIEEEGAVSFYGEDKTNADIDRLAQGRLCGVGSDGLALAEDGPLAAEREHPRCYGGMAYLIRTMVRERRVMPLERLIQKVTEFPARRMGLRDRGALREGALADVAVFDVERITDRATIENSCVYSEGVRWLFVNGVAVIAEGRATGARPGRVLRRETRG